MVGRLDDYYKDMKPLALKAVGYIQEEDEEEPHEYEVSVWVNDTYGDEDPAHGRQTVISIEGYSGTTQFGFELYTEECLKLSNIIRRELYKRGVPRGQCGTCKHEYGLHAGGEDCDDCDCTWFDTIGDEESEMGEEG